MSVYRVTLVHDEGRVCIVTSASSPDAAVRSVLSAERAPLSAVLSVAEVTP